ncbi:MAG: EFR1 family ferrodoxin [Clostridia bacterium]|nr:EFR1 family ferrodoxin [Clostridia bacterium]MDE7328719.1 EFR1 family ferrodoxin [Clostridia bacterium]
MIGILYFSSTGNSLWIAQKVKEKFCGKIVYIPKYAGNGSEFDSIVLVTPVYSFGMPTFVYDLLPKLDKSKEVIVIQNYGGMMGGADYLLYEYAKRNGLNIKAVYSLKMPENFTLSFTVPKFYLNSTLRKSHSRMERILNCIANGEYKIPKKKKIKEDTYLKNKSNWHLIGERFKCNQNCIKCGKCASICPVGNISMEDGKIVFGDKCVACLGCYHRCPNKAIVYLNKNKKSRYVNPNIEESEIGKDFQE